MPPQFETGKGDDLLTDGRVRNGPQNALQLRENGVPTLPSEIGWGHPHRSCDPRKPGRRGEGRACATYGRAMMFLDQTSASEVTPSFLASHALRPRPRGQSGMRRAASMNALANL